MGGFGEGFVGLALEKADSFAFTPLEREDSFAFTPLEREDSFAFTPLERDRTLRNDKFDGRGPWDGGLVWV